MSAAVLSPAHEARRRAAALTRRPSTSGAGRMQARFEAALASLALPVRTDHAARSLPAATLIAVGTAYALVGAAGPVVLVLAVVAATAIAHRTAPHRRAAATARALPLVLDAVARHLRAGGSLAQAITSTRPPGTAPDLQQAWARLNDLIPLVGVTAALDDWAARPRTSPDLHASTGAATSSAVGLAAAALSLAATTGGSPARAIDGVAATLRSRLAMADEIRALSSQSRASAAVIALSPVAFGILAGAGDPRTRAFLASPSGLVLLTTGLALDALGAWWMSRLCRPSAAA